MMTSPMMELIESDPGPRTPLTHAFVSSLDFVAEPHFAAVSKKERTARTQNFCKHAALAASVAAELLALSKPQMVALVGEKTEQWMSAYEELVEANETFKMLQEIVRSAEARLLVALTTIPEDPDGGDDGEEIAA